jgi:hypothetical protein
MHPRVLVFAGHLPRKAGRLWQARHGVSQTTAGGHNDPTTHQRKNFSARN